MAEVLVTVICSIGVVLAAAFIVSGRHLTSEEDVADPPGPRPPAGSRAREGLRQASAATAAGAIGGFLSLGLGGRLIMRILAATSPDAKGRITDAGERVGEVSVDGTIFLVFAGVFLGVIGALGYQAFRRLLPTRTLMAGVIGGGIAGGLLARPSGMLDPDNHDFAILSPTWLAVLLSAAVVIGGPLTIAVLVDRWTPGWPPPGLTVGGLGGLLPLIITALPPLFGFVGVFIAGKTVAVKMPQSAVRFAHYLVWVAGSLGLVWIGVSGAEILA